MSETLLWKRELSIRFTEEIGFWQTPAGRVSLSMSVSRDRLIATLPNGFRYHLKTSELIDGLAKQFPEIRHPILPNK